MQSRADLHSHSQASDGVLEPSKLVAFAASRGVATLAITDHDTMSGLREGREAASKAGIRFVDGVEISCLQGAREVHILGLFIDPEDAGLSSLLEASRKARETSTSKVLERLAGLGIQVRLEEVLRFASGETVGRAHIARALVALGHAGSIANAFDKYLGEDRPARVYRERPSVAEACDAIRGACGVSSLAHPGGKPGLVSQESVARMKDLGLDAIEAFHPSHDERTRARLLRWASSIGLGVSGGSDYHGTQEGALPGSCYVDEELLSSLEELRRR